MKKVITHSVRETAQEAKKWLERVLTEASSTHSNESAYVVTLSGNLGSGKTTFTQAVARELGVEETVTSPTFVIQKMYAIKNPKYQKKFDRLIHIDAYRIDDPQELEVIGFKTLLTDPKNLMLIEWPERAGDILSPTERISFTFVDEETREIEI